MEPRDHSPTRSHDALNLLISAALLTSIAIYNRYPLVWPDTGGYLAPVNLTFRSMFYSFFVYPSRLTGSLWPVVFAQALLIGYLLRLLLREVFAITSGAEFLIVIALLCLLTSLPWYVGFLMPDIFTPVVVLGLFLLMFCCDRLSRWERCYVAAVTFIAVVVHYAHAPIAIGLLSVALGVRLALRKRVPNAVPYLVMPTTIVFAGAMAIVASNYLTIDAVTFSPAGYAFQLSRLVADGQAVEYLRETCPERHYKLCGFLDRMPMPSWTFLWPSDGPIHRLGWLEERQEGLEIISGSIKRYPLWTLRSATINTIAQVALFETGASLGSYAAERYPTRDIKHHFPADLAAYFASRQARGELANLFRLNVLDVSVVIVSGIYCCLIAGLLIRDGQWLPIELMVTIALALLFNGFVSGALSQPDNRYGSRLIWLVPLVAFASWRKALGLAGTCSIKDSTLENG